MSAKGIRSYSVDLAQLPELLILMHPAKELYLDPMQYRLSTVRLKWVLMALAVLNNAAKLD